MGEKGGMRMGLEAKNQRGLGSKNHPKSDELPGTRLDLVTRPDGLALNKPDGLALNKKECLLLVNLGAGNLFVDSTVVQIDAESSSGASP